MIIPDEKKGILDEAEAEVLEIQEQYQSGLVTAGERYNKVVDIWSRTNERVAKAMMDAIGTEMVEDRRRQAGRAEVDELDLHHGRLGRAWFAGPDPSARRYARPDGQAGRLDHRDADHRELPRRPERPAVLHLDPRRPQGPRGYRAEDGELRLPDASTRRRRTGRGDHRGRLRHARGPDDDPDRRRRRRGRAAAASACWAASWPRTCSCRATTRIRSSPATRCSTKPGSPSSKKPACSRSRCARRSPAKRRFGVCANCYGRDLGRGHLVNHRRGGGRHRGAVDRRAGHAADHAYVPHRWCGIACGGDRQRHGQDDGLGQVQQPQARRARERSPGRGLALGRTVDRSTRTAASASATSCPTAR